MVEAKTRPMQSFVQNIEMHQKNPTKTAHCQTTNNNIKWKIHHIKSFARHWYKSYAMASLYNETATTTTTTVLEHAQQEGQHCGAYETRRSAKDTLAISCTDTINLRPFIPFGYALATLYIFMKAKCLYLNTYICNGSFLKSRHFASASIFSICCRCCIFIWFFFFILVSLPSWWFFFLSLSLSTLFIYV